MESTRAKVELMKPVILKAGIPIAISVAGLIFAKIKAKKNSLLEASNVETTHQEMSLENNPHQVHVFDSATLPSLGDEKCFLRNTHCANLVESDSQRQDMHEEEELLGLRRRIEELQEREWEIERRFLQYSDLKNQESVLTELRYMLMLEMARVESFAKEMSLMEAENRRLDDLEVEYMEVLEQLELSKSENSLLHRNVKKLMRKSKEWSRAIREKNLQNRNREAEILGNQEELEKRATLIKEMEDENKELKMNLDQLQQEKKQLVDRLERAEESASSKIEAEGMIMEEYNHLVNELEQVQKDREAEIKEVIYLRWCNACLRHELMRRDQEHRGQAEEEEEKKLELDFGGNGEIGDLGLEHELDGSMSRHGVSCPDISQSHSIRRKLIEKLGKLVERREKIKQKSDEKH